MAESPCRRSYFYVGGGYVDDGKGQHVFAGQIYVEQLEPALGSCRPYPLVFIHGGGQTGTIHFFAAQNWLNTPDGRQGWASYFLHHGYTIFIIDQASRGRSPHLHTASGETFTYPAELIERRFTATRHHGLWPEASLHSQWPGTGRVGDPIFDAYYASNVPTLADHVEEQRIMQKAGAALLDRIARPVIIVSHSQGGTHGWLWADSRPALVQAIVAVEPSGPPFRSTISQKATAKLFGITDIPLAYVDVSDRYQSPHNRPLSAQQHAMPNGKTYYMQQEPALKLKHLSQIPVTILTAEASYHANYDDVTVRFLEQAGVQVQHVRLGEFAIHGNGHLMFLEKNNLDIAALLQDLIVRLSRNRSLSTSDIEST